MHFPANFGFPIFLPIFIIIGSLIAGSRHKQENSQKKKYENFLERERLANSTRKQDISHLNYLALSLDSLPIGHSADPVLTNCEETLKSLSQKRILNLSGKSNTDLKLLYGPANLDDLWEYDENYHILSTTLLDYGKRQEELNHIEEAVAILEYASSLHIDSSKIYLLLASLYDKAGTPEKISQIKDSLQVMDEDFRLYVLKHLESFHTDE